MTPVEDSESNRAPRRHLVGRDREFAELAGALQSALTGRGQLFFIVGEPGIGKTRLAEELAHRAGALGAQALWGRCWEGGGAPAYWPWVQVLRDLAHHLDPAVLARHAGSGAALLAQLLPDVLPPPGDAVSLDSEPARFALFDALTTCLLRVAREQPLVLLLDDLHAADQPSLLLLRFLARELSGAHVMIAGTYRDSETQRLPDNARILSAASRFGHHIHLRGWPAGDVAQFVEIAFGQSPTPALTRVIHQATEGNAFYVDEVVRLLLAGNHMRLPADVLPSMLPIPSSVREAICERLQPLSGECHQLLQAAAVIGRDFELACLAAVCGLALPVARALLSEAEQLNVVAPQPDRLARSSFAHALIRETLYATQPSAQRAQRHGEVGAALEHLYADDLDAHAAELAHHFLASLPGGACNKAVTYAQRAGDYAAALLAFEDAAAHYARALEALALDSEADAGRRLELLLAFGGVQLRSAGTSLARATFDQAATLAKRLGANAELALAALGFADLGLGVPANTADPRVIALLDDALACLGRDDSPLRARLLGRLAAELSVSSQRERANQLSEQAVATARRLADASALATTLSTRYYVLWRANYVGERLAIASEIIQLADSLRDRELAMQGRAWRLLDLIVTGDLPRFDTELESYAQLAVDLRRPRHLWMRLNCRALATLWRGQFEQAEALATQSLELVERTDDDNARANPGAQLFAIRRDQGRLAEMEGAAQVLTTRYPASPVPRTMLALIACEEGRLADAKIEFERLAQEGFADLERERRIGVLPYLAEICAALGDDRRAALLYRLLEPYRDFVIPYSVSVCFGAATHFLGLLAATMGQWDRAATLFDDALAAHARTGGRPLLARTQVDYARMLLARNADDDPERAQRLLTAAMATATTLGMPKFLDTAKALAAQAAHAIGHRPPPAVRAVAVGGTDSSSPRIEPDDRGAPPVRAAKSGRVLSFPSGRASRAAASSPRIESPPAANLARGLSSDHEWVFRLEGEFWTVGDAAQPLRLKDSRGLQHVAYLLRHPGREFPVTDLVVTADARPLAPSVIADAQLSQRSVAAPDPGMTRTDGRARAAYRQRLADVDGELEEAERFNDLARAERLRAERDFLAQEVAAATGLAGRGQTRSPESERARVSVTRVIKATIKRIASLDQELGLYLRTTIRTGRVCGYAPDPRIPVRWQL